MRKPKKPPLKVVKKERKVRHKREEPQEVPARDWTLPSAHWVQLDLARWNHWWAVLNGGDTVKTLKAWAALLHVPRTKHVSTN